MNDETQTEIEQLALKIHSLSVQSRTSAETRFQIPMMRAALIRVAKECKQALSRLDDLGSVQSSLKKIQEATAQYDVPEVEPVERETNVSQNKNKRNKN